MFRAATVQDISNSRITRQHGKIVVVTRFYPRFLKRKLVDEYFAVLAPSKTLLSEFKASEKTEGDHDKGFFAIDYENKFTLEPEALEVLRELSEESQARNVYLVCHCTLKQCCHRDLLFLIAEKHFGAKIPTLPYAYSDFRKRLGEFAIP